MNRLASILFALLASLTLSSCNVVYGGWGGLYHHQGGYGKTYKQPSLSKAAAALRKLVPFEQPLLLPIKYKGAEDYQLFENWTVTVNGVDYTIPAGLVVDGASVPRACWFFMPPDGLHRGAALFHDWSYINRGNFTRGPPLTRLQTDEAFYNLMIEAGVSPARAGIAYRGVRLGGWAAWASIESPIILPVDRHRMSAPRFLPVRTPFSHIYAP